MRPRIPLGVMSDDDKVSYVMAAIRIGFYFALIRTGGRLTFERNTPYYETGADGMIAEKKLSISVFTVGLGMRFEHEGSIGKFRPGDLADDAWKVLLTAYDYPQKFDVFSVTDSGRTKLGLLSDII